MYKKMLVALFVSTASLLPILNAHCAAYTEQKICIIHVTDKDELSFGAFPWPRNIHAQLINKLNKSGARCIVLKYIFDKPSDDENDTALAEVIAGSRNVILPFSGYLANPKAPFNANSSKEYVIKNKLEKTSALSFSSWAYPIEEFAKNSTGVGSIDVYSPDRHVVKIPLLVKVDGNLYPSLPLMVISKILQHPISSMTAYDGYILAGSKKIKMDPDGAFHPVFSTPGSHFKAYSYSDILNDHFDANDLKDSIVIIGYDGTRFPVNFITPISDNHNGSDINADAVRSLLTELSN